jgi:hypothetical protein
MHLSSIGRPVRAPGEAVGRTSSDGHFPGLRRAPTATDERLPKLAQTADNVLLCDPTHVEIFVPAERAE